METRFKKKDNAHAESLVSPTLLPNVKILGKQSIEPARNDDNKRRRNNALGRNCVQCTYTNETWSFKCCFPTKMLNNADILAASRRGAKRRNIGISMPPKTSGDISVVLPISPLDALVVGEKAQRIKAGAET